MKEYKVITSLHIEDLIPEMNEASKEGWDVCYMLQEHAYTKVILERSVQHP